MKFKLTNFVSMDLCKLKKKETCFLKPDIGHPEGNFKKRKISNIITK